MWGFFTASIYFYLFEDFSIVLSITVFSTVTLPGPEKNNKPSHDDKTEEHIPKSLQLPTLLGQILSFSVPPFTWKYLVRKSFGELAWVLVKFSAKYHPNRYPQKPLSRKASDWIEIWFKPLLCYYRKFLQLDKFALPPSFGEIVQSRGKNIALLPGTIEECATCSIPAFTAAAVCNTAFLVRLRCLSELQGEVNVIRTCALNLHHHMGISLRLRSNMEVPSTSTFVNKSVYCHKSHIGHRL